MQVINEIYPSSPDTIQQMMEPGPEGPIFMVNLLKFRFHAEYEDGRETKLTGREAYMIYGRAVAELLPKYGAAPIFAGDVTMLMIGQVEELWDEVAIAAYPNRKALLDMSLSEEWQAISIHRSAGLKGQLNIETTIQDGFSKELGAIFRNMVSPA